MTLLQEAEKLLAAMSRAEKAQLLQWVVQDLGDAFPGIESVPGVCGGDPCIVRTRIPVWVLEQYRRLGARTWTCYGRIPRCAPLIWPTPGPMCGRIGRRSSSRSAPMRQPSASTEKRVCKRRQSPLAERTIYLLCGTQEAIPRSTHKQPA